MDRRRAAGALLALAACIACSAAAPTASNHTALDLYEGAKDGCYYNFQHYGEGDRIMTNEPCLNCTCHNRMLMCYLRVCPFTKAIGQDCTVEKRADQCCPIVTCPDVPVDLLTSTSTSSPAEYGATGLGKLDKYGCSINGKYFPEGSKVPPTPNKPCEHCYCIRNMTTCVMQECTLHVDGCTPIYHKDVCCPVRYSCDHPEDEVPLLDDMSTTVRPTPGFLLTTTTLSPVTQMSQDCVHNDQIISDGASITTEKACEHCYCMKGDIVCVVQECGAPMENEGKNCTSLPPREGQCCPDTYICEGDEPSTDVVTESVTDTFAERLTTLSPPRRTGVEGSGYRNEDEIVRTEMPTVESELEGSGEEQESPQGTPEPLIPGKPLGSEEEGEQYIPVTKAPMPISHATETSNDILENETIEPQISIQTTQFPPEEDIDKISEEPKEDNLKPYEHATVASPSIPENLENGTIAPSEDLNTVPDILPEKEHDKLHEYAPMTTGYPIKEVDTAIPQESEKPVSTVSYNEQDVTMESISQGSEYPTLSPGAEVEREITEKPVPEPVTIIETTEPSKIYIQATTGLPVGEEIGTVAPQTAEDTTTDKVLTEKDHVMPGEYATSTTNIPITEEIEKLSTELDHAQNTVGVVEEGTRYTPVPSKEVTEKSTLSDLGDLLTETSTKAEIPEIQHASSPIPIVKEEETTVVPDKGLNTIPSEINEESTRPTLLEMEPTEPTIIVDATDRQESDIKLSSVSELATSLPDAHITKGDQYTVTTEPSFRREDEASVSTEKPKEDSERTTAKADLIEEGLIPALIHDKEPATGSNIPSIDEYITTGIPDYIDAHKELEDTQKTSVKPVTETVLATDFVSESVSDTISDTTLQQESGIASSTEKSMDISAEYDGPEQPSRIPGEGDCLLNAVTYRNNTVVPSTNKCHIGCKCISSIIKCDPIICSPLPDNVHNCQSIYDTPDSCCPTYICDPRETVPPKSDSQMSGTEPPVSPPIIECRGDQCELSEPTKQPLTPGLHEVSQEPIPSECGPNGCDIKPQYGDQIPCKEENGCEHQQMTPQLDCIGDEPCRRKDTHIEQKLPTKCKGSHCVQETVEQITETTISNKTPIEDTPTKHVITEQEPSQPTDSHVTKESDAVTTPSAQIVTEHPLFGTTQDATLNKSTEKVDVDIATEEFILAQTEGTKQPDYFAQEGIVKPSEDETTTELVDTEEDNKKPIEEEKEGEAYKPDGVVDEHTDVSTSTKESYIPDVEQNYTDAPTGTESTKKPYDEIIEHSDKSGPFEHSSITPVEEYTSKIPDVEDQQDQHTVKPKDEIAEHKPVLTDTEGVMVPTVTEEHKPSLEEEPSTKTTDNIRDEETTQQVLTFDEATKTPDIIIESTETSPFLDKEVTKSPDSFVEHKTDSPSSLEENINKITERGDDKYTDSTVDRITTPSGAIHEAQTDIPSSIEDQTVHITVPGTVDEEQTFKPDLTHVEVTALPEMVKEHTDKTILIEDVSTKIPDVDVDKKDDKFDVTIEASTQLPDKALEEHASTPSLTEQNIPEISAPVTDKEMTVGDEVKEKPILTDEIRPDIPTVVKEEVSGNIDLNKDEGITQSITLEEGTEMPETIEDMVTKKPIIIDESTESSMEIEDSGVTNIPKITEETKTDKTVDMDDKITVKPLVTEEGTKIPDIMTIDKEYEVLDKEPEEAQVPQTPDGTESTVTREHEIPEVEGSGIKEPSTDLEEGIVSSEEQETDRPIYGSTVTETLDYGITRQPVTTEGPLSQEEQEDHLPEHVTYSQETLTDAHEASKLPERIPSIESITKTPDFEAVSKGEEILSAEDITKIPPGSYVTQISPTYGETSVPLHETTLGSIPVSLSEQDIKSGEPDVYTPEREEMITSSVVSSVTEPAKTFTEIDDTYVTGPEDSATGYYEQTTERVEPLGAEKDKTDAVSPSATQSTIDVKITNIPQESYTESYLGHSGTPLVGETETAYIPHKPEINTLLPETAEPTQKPDIIDSEKTSETSKPSFTDLPIPVVTISEDKSHVFGESIEDQKEKSTKVPDLLNQLDLGIPTSLPEIFVTRVQEASTAKPESHVTAEDEQEQEIKATESLYTKKPALVPHVTEITTEEPQKMKLPEMLTTPEEVDVKAPEILPLEEQKPTDYSTRKDDIYSTVPYVQITTEAAPSIVSDQQTDISSAIDSVTEKGDSQQIPDSVEKTTTKPTLDLEKTEGVKEPTDETAAVTEISETTPYLIELEEHTHKIIELPEGVSTILPATDEHDKEKAPGFDSEAEVTSEKGTLSTEQSLYPDTYVDRDMTTVLPSTAAVPVKEEESMIPDINDKYEPGSETGGTTQPLFEDKDSDSDEKPVSGSEEIIPTIIKDKYDSPEEKPTTESEELISPVTVDKYSKPEEQISEKPLSEDKDEKLDEKPISASGEFMPSVSEDKYGKPGDITTQEDEVTTPSISEDKYAKPGEYISSESGDSTLPLSEDKDGKTEEKPISGTEESISEDKYGKPEYTTSIDTETTVLPTSVDADSKPDKKPISEGQETTSPDSEDKYGSPDDKHTTETDDIPPSHSDKGDIPYKKPIGDTITTGEHDMPDEKPSSETETVPPFATDADGKPDEKPISGSEDIKPPVFEDKYSQTEEKPGQTVPLVFEEEEKKPTSGTEEFVPIVVSEGEDNVKPVSGIEEPTPSVSEDKITKPDEKPISGTEEYLPPVSIDNVSKPDEKPATEVEDTITPASEDKDISPSDKPISAAEEYLPPVSDNLTSKPDEQPISATEESVISVSEDKVNQPDEKPINGTEESVLPVSDDNISKPDEKPISVAEESMPPVSDDKVSKPDKIPFSGTEETVTPVAKDKDTSPDEKPISGAEESVLPVSEDKIRKPDEKPISGVDESVPVISEDKITKPEEKPISGTEEIKPTVSEDKDSKPDVSSSETDQFVPPISEDQVSKPDEKPITESEESIPSISDDKVSKPGEKPEEVVTPASEDKDISLDEKPISGTKESLPSVSDDKVSKPSEKPSSGTEETITPTSEDKDISPDEKPISGTEESLPLVPDEKVSIPDEKPVSGSEETVTPAVEDEDISSDQKPISATEESLPSVSDDKASKPDEQPISATEESVPSVSEDKVSQPDEKPISGTEESVLPVSEDKISKPDEQPISGTEESVTPASDDKDITPDETPISGSEEFVTPTSEDKYISPDEKPISGTEDSLTPVSDDKHSKPDEEFVSGTESTVAPTSEDKDISHDDKPISGSEESLTPASEDNDIPLYEKPISGTEESLLPVSVDKVSKPEDIPISGTEESLPPVSDDKVSKPEEEALSGTEASAIPTSEDKDISSDEKLISGTVGSLAPADKHDKPDLKPVSATEETVTQASEDKDLSPGMEPTSGTEESLPPLYDDKQDKLDEKPVSATEESVTPTSEDKEISPAEKPISGTEESLAPVSDDKVSKPDEKPISGTEESLTPVFEDKDISPDKKPISGIEETLPPVSEDKVSKPEDIPISGTDESLPPLSYDKVSKPDEQPTSGTEVPVTPASEDKDISPDEKPISGTEESIPLDSDDQFSKPDEKPATESEDSVTPATEDKEISSDKKPVSGTEESVTLVSDNKDNKPDEKPISGTEESLSPVSEDKISKPEERPISGTGEIPPSVSDDNVSKPDEKPVSGTEESLPTVFDGVVTKPDEKPISVTEETILPVTDDKYSKPEASTSSEIDATTPSVSGEKYGKPDEISSSQSTEITPPVADENYGKPDAQSIEAGSQAMPPSTPSEIPKPLAESQPTDDLPTPEDEGHFPPSGSGYPGDTDYVEEDQAFGPGTCRYGGKVYVSAQQIPRDDPCDFCFCFRSDIICLQQSCPPPIHGCHEEPIQGFCCPRYECPVSMATTVNVTTTTTTTTTTLPPHFPTHPYKGAAQRRGCQIKGHTYKVGDVVRSSSGPCLHCTCGGDGQMKCDPKACTPEPMLRQMIAAAVSAKRRR